MELGSESTTSTTSRFGRGMIVAAWLLVLAMLTLMFYYYLEQRENPNRDPVSRVGEKGLREVVLKRNSSGHYIAGGKINGQSVTFLLDTGATDVAISEHLANRLNLRKGAPGSARLPTVMFVHGIRFWTR